MAIEHRAPKPSLIHHTDQVSSIEAAAIGSVWKQQAYCPAGERKGLPTITQWRKASSHLKNGSHPQTEFLNRESARAAIFRYIELFYNRQRIHRHWICQSGWIWDGWLCSKLNCPEKPGYLSLFSGILFSEFFSWPRFFRLGLFGAPLFLP